MKPSQTINRTSLPAWTGLLLFAVLVGGLATLWGYRYGTGNQVEQLPVVLRVMDPAYLVNDFFVNASAEFSPRLQFARAVGAIANLAGGEAALPGVYLALTLLGNVAVAFVTGMAARDLFEDSLTAGLFAVAGVMALKTFWLGYTNVLYRTFLEPMHLAMPLLLLGAWAALRRRPLAAAAANAAAAYFHPLAGLEGGVLCLGISTAELGWRWLRGRREGVQPARREWLFLLAGLALMGVVAAWNLLGYRTGERLPDDLFIWILAYFRHPHHYLPGTFQRWQFVQAGLFLLAAFSVGVTALVQIKGMRKAAVGMGLLTVGVLLAALGGYVFVEVLPSRLWTTAQTLRMLTYVKWLGLVLMCGWSGWQLDRLSALQRTGKRWTGLMLMPFVLPAALLASPALIGAAIWTPLRVALDKKLPGWAWLTLDILALGWTIAIGIIYEPDGHALLLFPLLVMMSLIARRGYGGQEDAPGRLRRMARAVAGQLGVTFFVLVALFTPAGSLSPRMEPYLQRPVIDIMEVSSEELELARFVRENTPPDAVFLVNPSMGNFRVTAHRAIVVDFIAFPFGDQAMQNWLTRIYDVYGEPQENGFDAVPEMRNWYTGLDQRRIKQLGERYGFEYMVMYTGTHVPDDFEVLYETPSYRLVKLPLAK